VGLHIGSHHIPNEGVNNTNPGVYAQLSNGLLAGTYRNSYNRRTNYVGWQTPELLRLSVVGALATGYTAEQAPRVGSLSLIGGIHYRAVTIDSLSFNVLWVPRVQGGTHDVLHLTASWRFR
jgi:hypothetical protein